MSYGGLPRDYKMPTVDPDDEHTIMLDKDGKIPKFIVPKIDTEEFDKYISRVRWDISESVGVSISDLGIDVAECKHKWKHYMGLREQFDYCEKCDAKRK